MPVTVNVNLVLKAQDCMGYLVNVYEAQVGETVAHDHVYAAGTIDLAPILAQLGTVKALAIKAESSDFTISLDGGLNFSTRKYKCIFFDNSDLGAQTIQITLSQQSRVQIVAFGD